MSATGIMRRNEAELFGAAMRTAAFGAFEEDRDEAELFGVSPADWAAMDENDLDQDLVGWKLFKKLKRGIKKVSRAVKKVAKNPLVKVGLTGLAFVVPGASAVTMAAKVASQANKLYDATKSSNPKKKKAAQRVVKNTQRRAKAGDPAAKRAVKVLSLAAKQRGRLRPKRRQVWSVYADGKIERAA